MTLCDQCGERRDDVHYSKPDDRNLCLACFTSGNTEPALADLGVWLEETRRFVRRFVVLSDEQLTAIALWVAHTHAFKASTATPYLSVSSAEMESGKTRLLEVLRLLVAKPWFTGRTTAAALTRKIDKSAPTLLLDEGDPAFNGDKEYAEALRGVLNTGYRKGGAVTVCTGQGANLDVTDLSTFAPKAIAGIGRLPDTVASRSISIRLKKRLASERIERFRERKVRDGADTIREALSNCLDESAVAQLANAEPPLPDALSDRAQDVWEPLLALADAAGGEWVAQARTAAEELSKREGADETTGVRLLADCREAFNGSDRLKTSDLLGMLHAMEEAPWGEWYGKPLSAQKLAKLLRPFDVKPGTIWLGVKSTAKGYTREDFGEAWARHLLPPDSEPSGRQDGSTKPETPLLEPSGVPPPDDLETAEKPHEQANLTTLTGEDGGYALATEEEEEAARRMLAPFEEDSA